MDDYLLFLEEIGATPEQMDAALAIGIPFSPSWFHCVKFGPSNIHGIGMFAKFRLPSDYRIGDGKTGGEWSQAGRFTNHSADPNLKAVPSDFGFDFVTTREVGMNEELTVNYRSVKAAMEQEVHHV
jgi:hypothetical protein